MSAASSQTVVELIDVTKQYPGHPPVLALDQVSVRVGRGESVAIVGPSGSGKSTLLNVIGTLDRPSGGQVSIDGQVVRADTPDQWLSTLRCRLIGFVFQSFHLLDGVSAVDNVATGLLYAGTGRAERQERAAVALRRVGLGHRLIHHPGAMSGGERQRVAIARAIVGQPAIVLADEPTGNLDSRTSEAVMKSLHDLNDDGVTVLVITHDRDVAERFDRQVEMRDGRIVSDSAVGMPAKAEEVGS